VSHLGTDPGHRPGRDPRSCRGALPAREDAPLRRGATEEVTITGPASTSPTTPTSGPGSSPYRSHERTARTLPSLALLRSAVRPGQDVPGHVDRPLGVARRGEPPAESAGCRRPPAAGPPAGRSPWLTGPCRRGPGAAPRSVRRPGGVDPSMVRSTRQPLPQPDRAVRRFVGAERCPPGGPAPVVGGDQRRRPIAEPSIRCSRHRHVRAYRRPGRLPTVGRRDSAARAASVGGGVAGGDQPAVHGRRLTSSRTARSRSLRLEDPPGRSPIQPSAGSRRVEEAQAATDDLWAFQ